MIHLYWRRIIIIVMSSALLDSLWQMNRKKNDTKSQTSVNSFTNRSNENIIEPISNILIWLTLEWVQRKKFTFHHSLSSINSMMTQTACTEVAVENFQMCIANTIRPNGKLPAPHSHSVEVFFFFSVSHVYRWNSVFFSFFLFLFSMFVRCGFKLNFFFFF